MLPEDDLAASPASRAWGRAMLAVFVLVLASAWLIGRSAPPVDENRRQTTSPPLAASLAMDVEAHHKIDASIRDAIPLARLTVPALASLGYAAGYSLRSDVWQGSDGQLFFRGDFALPCRSKPDIATLSRSLREPATQGADPQLRLVIPPNKSTVLRDQLWSGPHVSSPGALTSCEDARRSELARLAAEHPRAITLVDGVTEAAAQFGQPAFYKGDTHWTPAGAGALALRLGTWVAPDRPFPPATQASYFSPMDRSRPGVDLYRMAGLRRADSEPYITSSPPGVRPTEVPDPAGGPWVEERTVAPGAPLPGRTLIYADSFFDSARRTLIPLFTDLTVLTNKRDVRPYLNSHRGYYDHVIVVAVERHAADAFQQIKKELVASLKPHGVSWQQPHWPTS